MDPTRDPDDIQIRRRLDELEQASMFVDRHADQLDEQVLAITKGVRELSERLARLEARIEGLSQAMERAGEPSDDALTDPLQERPPHASRPRPGH